MNSLKSHRCLHKTLLILVCLEILSGLLTAAICEYTKIFLRDNIFQIDKHEVLSVVLMTKIYGLHVSICFTGGIVVILLFKDVYTRHLKVCVILWIFLSIETVIGALCMSWVFSDTMNYVTTNFEESLQYGIKFYETDPQWVLIFDNLQYNYKCCGVYNQTDWKKIVLSSSREENVIRLLNNLILPYSCAKDNMATKDEDSIHSRGCFHVIYNIIENINKAMMTINGFIAFDVVSSFIPFDKILSTVVVRS